MVAPRIKLYKCSKCNETVFSNEIEAESCPLCQTRILKHKDCGGLLSEVSLLGMRQH